ncbi:MAG TPA: ADP-ribosylglycohydrolase family protein [Gemmatimonadales bacterium]|jgi:ADP-ribosyl-[dinitrogen reductase] hydrolase|nr:ADP-ribosylglycohydrolase family protein [Gemmatimonadales bacterium]
MMVKPPITLVSRARGALLAHACGNALGVPTEFLGTPDRIRQQFPDGIRGIIRQDTLGSPFDDDVAMAVLLGEWVAEGARDARDLLARWLRWARSDGRGIGTWTSRALDIFDERQQPPTRRDSRGQAGNGAVMRALPLALATLHSPRNLISATLHTAELTHPEPEASWPAVAVNVAAHCLLKGRRDFIPEVIAALEVQVDVPFEVLDAVRRVPFGRREALPITGPASGHAVNTMEIALWTAHHEPNLERGLLWLASAGGDTDTNAAVAGGLMGARDGEEAIPPRWLDDIAQRERLVTLAERLIGTPATTTASRA